MNVRTAAASKFCLGRVKGRRVQTTPIKPSELHASPLRHMMSFMILRTEHVLRFYYTVCLQMLPNECKTQVKCYFIRTRGFRKGVLKRQSMLRQPYSWLVFIQKEEPLDRLFSLYRLTWYVDFNSSPFLRVGNNSIVKASKIHKAASCMSEMPKTSCNISKNVKDSAT